MAETGKEHLDWAKQRALEIVETGDVSGAWSSMISDLQKHEQTANHMAVELGTMLILGGHLRTAAEMKNFIEGLN